LGASQSERLQRPAAAVAVTGGVDDHVAAAGARPADDGRGEDLHRVDRLSVPPDEEAEVVAEARRLEGLVRLLHLHPAADADRRADVLEHLPELPRELALVATA